MLELEYRMRFRVNLDSIRAASMTRQQTSINSPLDTRLSFKIQHLPEAVTAIPMTRRTKAATWHGNASDTFPVLLRQRASVRRDQRVVGQRDFALAMQAIGFVVA